MKGLYLIGAVVVAFALACGKSSPGPEPDRSWQALPPHAPAGARVVVQHPRQPLTLYAYGLPTFLTRDGGKTWSTADFPAPGAFPANARLLISPTDPNLMFAIFEDDGGLLRAKRSRDGGQRWEDVPPPPETIAFDHHDSDLLYGVSAAAPELLKSVDAGSSWQSVPLPTAAASLGGFTSDPGQRGGLFLVASVTAEGGPAVRLLASTDAGLSWETRALPGEMDPAGASLHALAARSGSLFAWLGGMLWRSTDRGVAWEPVRDFGPTSLRVFAPLASEAALYVFAGDTRFKSADGGATWVESGAKNHREVVHEHVVLRNTTAAVELSTDDGKTFKHVVPRIFGKVRLGPGKPASLYVMNELMLWRSLDEGQSWFGYPVPEEIGRGRTLLEMFTDPVEATVMYALSLEHATGEKLMWRTPSTGGWWGALPILVDGNRVSVTTMAPSRSSRDVIYAATESNQIFRSDDHGGTWRVTPFPGPGALALTVAPSSVAHIYVLTSEGVVASADGGQTWRNQGLADELRERAGAPAFITVDPRDPLVAYVSTAHVHKTTDGGATWTVLEEVAGGGQIAIAEESSNLVYAANGYRSRDAGRTWTQLSHPLLTPWTPATALALDPTTPGTIYAFNDSGLVRSKPGTTKTGTMTGTKTGTMTGTMTGTD